MQISVQTGELKNSSAKAIIVTLFEGANTLTGARPTSTLRSEAPSRS
jgi:hypothetical protein